MDVVFRRITAVHRGRTKTYQLTIITTDTGRGMLIKRWGKVGTFGQMSVEVGDARSIRHQFDAKYREKFDGEYTVDLDDELTKVTSVDELKRVLTLPVWYKLGAANIAFLFPEEDTTDVRAPEEIKWMKVDDRYVVEPKPPMPMPVKEETIEDKVAANPLWGAF